MKLNERKTKINLADRMTKFKTEEEEANWWDQHEDVALEMMRDAWPEMFKKEPTEPISLRVPVTQLAVVREYASRSGERYQTVLKRFIEAGAQSLVAGRCATKLAVVKRAKGKSKPAKAKTNAHG